MRSRVGAWLSAAVFAAATVACSGSDAGITTAVKSKLAADDTVKAYRIDVDTSNAVVTLNGQVDTARARARAVELAKATDGVRDVPVVRNPPPTALGGRGVMFVDRLSSSWGTSEEEGDAAKAVWFELRHDDVSELGHFTAER